MIGEEIRASVFRDTTTLYHTMPEEAVAKQLIKFTQKYAGKSILDLGCATGNYSVVLKSLGYEMKGADVNAAYIARARERGIDAFQITDGVPLPDKCVDTVICFEVIEHVPDLHSLITEAKRLARKKILFTTPNSEHVEQLMQNGLLYEHFAELDHKNFFTIHSLTEVLSKYFTKVHVQKGDGINPFALFGFTPIRMLGKVLTKVGIIRPKYHFRLFAVCNISENNADH
ncbi:MAG: class I SAM-dependent methyltransferase [Bacteroidota bacterium]